MYFVKYGKEYLHDPRFDEYQLLDLTLECEENSCGYCDFTIYSTHPMYDKLKERDADNPIEVYDDDVLLFKGFIYELGKEFYLDGLVKCKGELDYLSESIIRPYSTIENGYGDGQQPPTSVNGYFEWLISKHNAQVSDNKRFTVGINQGASLDTNNYIYRESTKYPNTWKEISEKLLDNLGGYIRVRYDGDTRYIDYLYEWTDTNSQILDFGKNLTDYTQTDDSESIATFVVPLGARMSETTYFYDDGYYKTADTTMDPEKDYYTESENGYTKVSDEVTSFETGVTYYEYFELFDESNLPLTVVDLDDKEYDSEGYRKSNDIVYCESAVKKYGWIGALYENSDITTKEQLVSKSIVALKELISPKRTIEIKAVDMHLVNPEITPIQIGEYVRVRSKPHNLDSYFLCTSIDLDLNNPENSLYTLGTTFDTLTGQQNKRIKLLNASISETYEKAERLTEQEKENAKAASTAIKKAEEANTKADEANTKADEANSKSDEANSKADTAIDNAKDAADAAQDAATKADEANSNVTLIESKVETIKESSDKAQQDAADAKEAANTAQSKAEEASNAASNAQTSADSAQSKADEAYDAVGNVKSQVDNITKEVTDVKEDAAALRDDLEGQIKTVTNTMTADYAKKSELSSVEASLKTEISTSAAGVKSEVSQTYATKKDLATTDSKADAAQEAVDTLKNTVETNYSTKSEVKQLSDSVSSTVSSVEEIRITSDKAQATAAEAKTAADAAKADAAKAKSNADTAQSAADAAKEAANTAQTKANEAATNLATAEKNLADLQAQANVTDEQLAAAKKDVENARTAADSAQADADAAAKAASDAQKTADTAKANASTAQATANAAKEAADSAQADVDALTNRVTKAETSIKQNTEQIALRATKEEVTESAKDAVEQSKTYADAQIKLSSDEIKSTVSKTYATNEKVDNLQVGGRNLLRNTGKMDKITKSSNVTLSEDNEGYAVASFAKTSSLDWNYIGFTAPPILLSKILNKTITISFEVKSDDYEALNASTDSGLRISVDTCPADSTKRERFHSEILYDIELSNTRWVKVAKTFDVTEKWFVSGSGEITNTTRSILKIFDYSTYRMDIRKVKLEVGNIATDWTVAPEDVDDTIDGLNVIGKNLALLSDQEIENDTYNIANYDLSEDLIPGNTYTAQIWGEVGEGKTYFGLWISRGYQQCGTILNSGENYGTLTFTCPEITKGGDYRYDRINVYALPQNVTASSKITKFKLEKGESATEWSAAPEDMLSKSEAEVVYTSQTDFTQTSDEIRMDFKKSITSATDDMQSKIQDSNDKTDNRFQVINRYIRFIDGKIVLGEENNELVLTIQNDRVSFTQAGVEVAYFSNNNLYIKKAEVLTTLKIGNYEFTPRNDGGLALRKRGN